MCQDCNDGTLKLAIRQLSTEILDNNIAKGFEPDPKRTFGDEVALLHAEVSEALEAFRKWGFDDATIKRPKNENDELVGPLPKPEGVASEFADIFIRLLHYARVHDIDLIAETRRKMEFNKTRAYRHGDKNL